MPRHPTTDEIYSIADSATDIFASLGYYSCLFGSAACALFGTTRTPNDLDIVVFNSHDDPEYLKETLVANDSNFYLVQSANPNATHQVLWYSLPTPRRARYTRKCKVDIVVPGIMDIPEITRGRIVQIGGLPVMPLFPLLLMKLRGWSDHRESYRQDFQDKVPVDVEDISELLRIACDKPNVRLSRSLWLPRHFLDAAQWRIDEFLEESDETAWYWETLGFAV